MKHNRKWSESETRFVLENKEFMTDKAIAANLSRITGENITHHMVRDVRRRTVGDKRKKK